MRVRIMEDQPGRLRDLAKQWGVKTNQRPEVLASAIANAYRMEVAREERRAMREAHVRRLKEQAA